MSLLHLFLIFHQYFTSVIILLFYSVIFSLLSFPMFKVWEWMLSPLSVVGRNLIFTVWNSHIKSGCRMGHVYTFIRDANVFQYLMQIMKLSLLVTQGLIRNIYYCNRRVFERMNFIRPMSILLFDHSYHLKSRKQWVSWTGIRIRIWKFAIRFCCVWLS